MPAAANEHPRVPLTRFHNNTGEFLDLATKQPVVLTSHGRERHVIADHMNIEAVASSDMTEADRQAFANARPSDSELANDRWED